MEKLRRAALCALPILLAGCAVGRPPATVDAPAPAAWQAPLPHGGRLEDLAAWWTRWNDPLLSQWIEAAQAVSPTLASARSRLLQAQAARVAAGAALAPRLDGTASMGRGNTQPPIPLATTARAGLQAAWEIDLFGASRGAADAATARAEAARAGWHEARVSVAAETATAYLGLRACERLLAVARDDAASRAETARLTQLTADAGFAAPASADLARASAAEGAVRLRQQQAQCEVERQALAALTGIAPPALQARLAQAPAQGLAELAPRSLFAVPALPAQVLAQRPDVYQASLAVAAASADAGAAHADRFPRITLAGSIAAGQARIGGVTSEAPTWSIGPLALTLPLFDGGRRAASLEAAQARYDEAVALYRARVRQAVSEVEQALLVLDSARGRTGDAMVAAQGFRASFAATEARHRGGLASLVELEDARRSLLAAETGVVGVQRELNNAWIQLYRAAGGGWQ
ncbi:efflux transporter outer membrane subunit [Ramlibacter sp. MAHUQ-53]|uniref:efflux transporter outer membrane subunit n=1 Tax=unclassified Ramlibacter TaxID=2617605 RepID=UPI00364052EE